MNNQFGKKPIKFPQRMVVPPKRSLQQEERMRVIDYLQKVSVDGMRKHLCFSCSHVRLYDKNNKQYLISRTMTLDEVKNIVEEIRKVNSDGGN